MAQTQSRDKTATEIAVALATAGAGYLLIATLVPLLLSLGLSSTSAYWLANKVAAARQPIETGLASKGPAQLAEERAEVGWDTLFVLASADRLLEAGNSDAQRDREARYFEQHVAAAARRLRAAALQDATALLAAEDGLLSWRTLIDERTTPECRWANGKNFEADKMPVIGWPGAVHVRCRCTPAAPIPGAPLIPSV